ncbi:MAG: YggT family protein [Solirubrobacterales bacterium]
MILAATSFGLASYVNAVFIVYLIMILVNVLLSFAPRVPYYPWLRAVLDFVTESTDPYLNIFRRLMRPIGGGGVAIDLSPMLAIVVLVIAQGIVVRAILE